MNDDQLRLGIQIRQALDQGTNGLDPKLAARLREMRGKALERQKRSAAQLSLAGLGGIDAPLLWGCARSAIAILALMMGMAGTYYWNKVQDAEDYAEIDSELLADDLPVAAYTDKGFAAWVERSAQSSQSSPQ